MSKLAFKSNEGGTGTVLLATPVVDTDITVTLPSRSGVLAVLEKDVSDFSVNGIKFGSNGVVNAYAVCSNSASTVAKTVTIDGFTLTEGAQITILFGNGNTASNPTLSVNGGTAVPLMMNGANLNTTAIKANDVLTFVYDGSYFRGIGGMAVRDGAGNVIATTYVKSTNISSLTNRVASLESEIESIKTTYMKKSEYQNEVDTAYASLS